MDEGGGEVAVTGEEEGGEVSRIPLFYDLPSDKHTHPTGTGMGDN